MAPRMQLRGAPASHLPAKRPPETRRWFVTAIVIASLATAGLRGDVRPLEDPGEHAKLEESHGGHTPPPNAGPERRATSDAHALTRLVLEYDRLYARIAADPGVRLNPNHELWAQWRELLTPDSPLQAFWVVSPFDPGDPRNYRQVAGGTLPEQLRPGDRNAELPMIHELLGDIPEGAGRELTVPACIHHDFQTFDAQGRGIELSTDAQVPGSVTFRRGADGWRLHTYGWDWNRVCERCGPEPPGTAHVTWILGEPRPLRPPPPCPSGS